MRNEPFHLGTALHSAWLTVIQIGIANWRNIWKQSTPQRVATFHVVWTANPAFYTMTNTPNWQFLPNATYLSQDLASRPAMATPRPQVQILHPCSPMAIDEDGLSEVEEDRLAGDEDEDDNATSTPAYDERDEAHTEERDPHD